MTKSVGFSYVAPEMAIDVGMGQVVEFAMRKWNAQLEAGMVAHARDTRDMSLVKSYAEPFTVLFVVDGVAAFGLQQEHEVNSLAWHEMTAAELAAAPIPIDRPLLTEDELHKVQEHLRSLEAT